MPPPPGESCAVCGQRADRSCLLCGAEHYCFAPHQYGHWLSAHKGECDAAVAMADGDGEDDGGGGGGGGGGGRAGGPDGHSSVRCSRGRGARRARRLSGPRHA